MRSAVIIKQLYHKNVIVSSDIFVAKKPHSWHCQNQHYVS